MPASPELPPFCPFEKRFPSQLVRDDAFFMSLAYNVVGLSWAVRGALTPEVSAILMPISSLSVVAFTTLYTRHQAKKIFAA